METTTNETVKKANPFLLRAKAAFVEIGGAFKTLSMDAKIIVLLILAILIGGLFCGSLGGEAEENSSETSSGSFSGDVKNAWSQGVKDAEKDPEYQQAMKDVKKGASDIKKGLNGLKGAASGLGF